MRRAAWRIPITAMALMAAVLPAAAGHRRGVAPDRAFQLRLGGFFPSGGGELLDTNEEVFTQDVSDFNDVAFGVSYVHSINNHLEVGLNADLYEGTSFSAYRDWVDEEGFPIFHDARLATLPLTVDLRVIPGGRYRLRGSRHVLKPVFYLGAGIGMNLWEYEEVGDFLDFDFDPPELFFDRFRETGVAFQAHALVGVELPVGDRISVTLEGRHSTADDQPDGDFAGLGKLELGGTSVSAGVAFRF